MVALRARLEAATKADTENHSKELLGLLHSTLTEMDKKLSLTSFSIFLICILYEMSQNVEEVEFFGVSIKDLGVVRSIFPAVIGFVYFSLITNIIARRLRIEAYINLFKRAYPKFYECGLDDILRPNEITHTYYVLSGGFRRLEEEVC